MTNADRCIDRAAILRLCNDIEDIACDISQQTMNDIVSAESRMIFDKAKEIAAKIREHPKTNGDRIRQMTDEELAEWLDHVAGCGVCVLNEGKYRYSGDHCAHEYDCIQYIEKWLKQEVQSDAGND